MDEPLQCSSNMDAVAIRGRFDRLSNLSRRLNSHLRGIKNAVVKFEIVTYLSSLFLRPATKMVSEFRSQRFELQELTWVLAGSEASESTFHARVKTVLSHFGGGSPTYKEICQCSKTVLSQQTGDAFNNAFVTDTATEVKAFDAVIGAITDKEKWLAFKALI